MDSYKAFFTIAFKNAFAYRSSVFMGIVGSIFSIVAQLALWKYIFRQNENMFSYMTAYVIIAQLMKLLYTNNISNLIGNKVNSGDFVIDMIKPINHIFTFWSTSLGATSAKLVNQGIPLLIFFSPFLIPSHIDLFKLINMLLICICGYVMTSLMYILVGYLAFLVIEVWPYIRLIDDTIRLFAGAVIPITFFPMWLQNFTGLLPFQYLYSFPIRLILGDITTYEIYTGILIMIAWILFLSVLLKIVYSLAIKRCVVQGG